MFTMLLVLVAVVAVAFGVMAVVRAKGGQAPGDPTLAACTSCGAPLTFGQKFCAGCGSPTGVG